MIARNTELSFRVQYPWHSSFCYLPHLARCRAGILRRERLRCCPVRYRGGDRLPMPGEGRVYLWTMDHLLSTGRTLGGTLDPAPPGGAQPTSKMGRFGAEGNRAGMPRMPRMPGISNIEGKLDIRYSWHCWHSCITPCQYHHRPWGDQSAGRLRQSGATPSPADGHSLPRSLPGHRHAHR